MAGITAPFLYTIGDTYFGDSPDISPNASPVDKTPITAQSGSTNIHAVVVDATRNVGEDVSVRMYNATTVTVGTTLETMGFRVPKGTKLEAQIDPAYTMGTGLTYVVTQEDLGDSGTGTNPSGNVYVYGMIS